MNIGYFAISSSYHTLAFQWQRCIWEESEKVPNVCRTFAKIDQRDSISVRISLTAENYMEYFGKK